MTFKHKPMIFQSLAIARATAANCHKAHRVFEHAGRYLVVTMADGERAIEMGMKEVITWK